MFVRLKVTSYVTVEVDSDDQDEAEELALSLTVDEVIDDLEDFEFEVIQSDD